MVLHLFFIKNQLLNSLLLLYVTVTNNIYKRGVFLSLYIFLYNYSFPENGVTLIQIPQTIDYIKKICNK